MAKYLFSAAPHVPLWLCFCFFGEDSWPSIVCVKGFKAAKEIIEHAALSLSSKPRSVSTKRIQTKHSYSNDDSSRDIIDRYLTTSICFYVLYGQKVLSGHINSRIKQHKQ